MVRRRRGDERELLAASRATGVRRPAPRTTLRGDAGRVQSELLSASNSARPQHGGAPEWQLRRGQSAAELSARAEGLDGGRLPLSDGAAHLEAGRPPSRASAALRSAVAAAAPSPSALVQHQAPPLAQSTASPRAPSHAPPASLVARRARQLFPPHTAAPGQPPAHTTPTRRARLVLARTSALSPRAPHRPPPASPGQQLPPRASSQPRPRPSPLAVVPAHRTSGTSFPWASCRARRPSPSSRRRRRPSRARCPTLPALQLPRPPSRRPTTPRSRRPPTRRSRKRSPRACRVHRAVLSKPAVRSLPPPVRPVEAAPRLKC